LFTTRFFSATARKRATSLASSRGANTRCRTQLSRKRTAVGPSRRLWARRAMALHVLPAGVAAWLDEYVHWLEECIEQAEVVEAREH
jgi:hypothetical protein